MPPTSRRQLLQGSLALAGLGLLSGCGLVPLAPQGAAGSRRIGFLVPNGNPPQFEAFREGLRDLGYVEAQNVLIEYRDAEGDVERLPTLTAELVRVPVEVVVPGGVLGGVTDPRIGGEVLTSRLPAVAEPRAFAVAGGLLAHGPDLIALARRSASYVDKILQGAKPAELPIELPTVFEFIINLKSAQALGLTIPQSILQRATETIQ